MSLPGSRVLVTGAAGFVGRALVARLPSRGAEVRAVVRRSIQPVAGATQVLELGDLAQAAWEGVLEGVDAIVHLAARAHHANAASPGVEAAYRHDNVEATARLAEAALAAGVRRFVYASSIKVNGEASGAHPFTEADPPRPEDSYGRSKREAEERLLAAAANRAMEVVILRFPLVYGPGVRGNFHALLNAVAHGMPLPFARIANARSLVYRDDLVAALIATLEAPSGAGGTYLVAGDEPVSTPALVRAIGDALGRPARLFPVPPALLRLVGAFTGRSAAIARLTGSLVVDSSRFRAALGWEPRWTLAAGLRETARWFHAGGSV